MRDFLQQLRATTGLAEPSSVSGAVLLVTSLGFFRIALLPEFGEDLSMSAFQLGAVTTVFATGRLVADLPGGYLADRFPVRAVMATAAAAVAIASLGMGLSTALLPLYGASFMLGLASATTNATGMTYFSNVGGSRFRGTSMALFSAGLLGGQAVGPAAAGLLASAYDWRVAMYVAAGVATLVAVGLALNPGRRTSVQKARPTTETGGTGPRLGSMLVLQAVAFAFFLTQGSVVQTLVPLVGSEELSLGAAFIGLALGMGGLGRFVGTMVGGRLSDKVSRKAALVPALAAQAVGVGMLALPPSVFLWVGAIIVMSLASFAITVAATILGDLADPGTMGKHLGRFRFIGDLGLISGPLVVTALYQGMGREAAFGLVAGVLALVALVSLRFLPETGDRFG